MAGRILNRRELRKQAEGVGQTEAIAPEAAPADVAPAKKKTRARPATPAKPRAARAKKAPPRMRARWGLFDQGMKQVAIFDYNQRAAADQKLADLQLRNKGVHFLQMVKEPMPTPSADEAAGD
jgi:hypothetical protein